MKKLLLLFLGLNIFLGISSKEFHVSKEGKDANPGTAKAPFLTIQSAANVAQAGDVITVHEGVYREKVVPIRGGLSDSQRITYRAAKGEKVHIKGSEEIRGWKNHEGTVWKVTVPNSFFGDFNPFKELIYGDWFKDNGRDHHRGDVYLNGKSLWEMASLEDVFNPKYAGKSFDRESYVYAWYSEVDENNTTIFANFQEFNPNREFTEINVRNACFYPAETGINYITVRGFRMSQAATNWAPPTAEQEALIGTFWSKGWIIEDNVISDSRCTGITLGKDKKSGHHLWTNFPIKGGAVQSIEMIIRIIKNGWTKENIGSHIVRNNTIFNCEQAGMCGSMGAIYSQVYGNHIFNINRRRLFAGAEIAAIKFHAPVDMIIRNNHLHHAFKGLWVDWMTEGTRISGNVCYHNEHTDMLSEVNHGPYLFDNNIFLTGIISCAQGGAYVHNLIAGKNIVISGADGRYTPYFHPHTTELMGFAPFLAGDDRFYNNIFIKQEFRGQSFSNRNHGFGLEGYNQTEGIYPMFADNNLYYQDAIPYKDEKNPVVVGDVNPTVEVIEENGEFFLQMDFDDAIQKVATQIVTTQILGRTISNEGKFENPDGTPLKIDTDLLGNKRSQSPTVGPFEKLETGKVKIKFWQEKHQDVPVAVGISTNEGGRQ